MPEYTTFSERLVNILLSDINNDHQDNYDSYLLGDFSKLYDEFSRHTEINVNALMSAENKKDEAFRVIEKIGASFDFLYEHLETENDRELLLNLCSYKIIGPTKTKLPVFDAYTSSIKETEKKYGKVLRINTLNDSESFKSFLLNFNQNENNPYRIIRHFDLRKINIPAVIYDSFMFVFQQFILRQYEYRCLPVSIKVNKDDIVIDAGACWGETALLFSRQTGPGGRVYAFEMMSDNIRLFKKNMALNPVLAQRVFLVEQPVAETSHQTVYLNDYKTASNISLNPANHIIRKKTICIDDFIERNKISKVDFIKMDIEGAEISALKGCEKTIKCFSPNLAICVYHKNDDFDTIPKLIKSLNPNYKLYLKHNGIFLWETVLFATVNPKPSRSPNQMEQTELK